MIWGSNRKFIFSTDNTSGARLRNLMPWHIANSRAVGSNFIVIGPMLQDLDMCHLEVSINTVCAVS